MMLGPTAAGTIVDQPPADRPEPLIQLEGVTKSFGEVRALRGVSFDLLPGEVHALLGQNGAGKSTLIKILAGVTQKDDGRIRILGREAEYRSPAEARDAGLAVVYQELSLIPAMSVADNLYLAREPSRLGIVDRGRLSREALSFLKEHGLPLNPRSSVESLPFAYRQLTEIAKALSGKVRILVLDEPTSALSGDEEDILFDAIAQVTQRGVGVIYVTHRLSEVFRLSNRVTVLRDGSNVLTFPTSEADMASLVAAIVGPGREDMQLATIVGLGPRGENPVPPESVHLSPAESAAARAAGYKVGVVLHTISSDWSRQQVQGISEALARHGAELVGVTDAEFHADRQVDQLAQMVERGPNAIVSIPVDDTATAEAYRAVARAGVKLVLMDNAPKGLVAGADYSALVSADNFGLGQVAAELLAPHVARDATVGVVGFEVDFFATDQRELAFKRWMADHRPDVTVVDSDFPEPEAAGSAADILLTRHPDLAGIFVVWDTPAMAVVRSLQAAGRNIPVTTVDLGNDAALELAKGGLIKGIAAQQPYDQGVAEAEAALQALLGKEPPAWIALPAVAVTQENVLAAYERVWHAPPPTALMSAHAAARPATVPREAVAAAEPATRRDAVPLVALIEARNDRLRGVNLAIQTGEIVGLAGMVGSGRTEILETIFGLRPLASGELRIRGEAVTIRDSTDAIRRGIALVPEDRHIEGLILEHSIEVNLALPRLPQLGRLGLFRSNASYKRAWDTIRELSIKAPSPKTPVRSLSGGNQQKVVFGKWRDPSPVLLLLDEPTVGVDVGAREQIYAVVRGITAQGATVLVVSSELAELILLCDRICIVADGRVVKEVTRAEIENEEHLHRLVQDAEA